MEQPPRLTDRSALLQHRARAARNPVMFVQEAMADDIQERLEEVNRTFTDIAIVTGWPQIWDDRIPGATIVPDDDTLALTPGGFDLVIHALCLHWANDPVGQLVQCRHALRPDGLVLATLFGGQTLHELRSALAQSETVAAGGLSPRVAPMAEIRDLGGLLQRAGFALPVADASTLNVSYDSPRKLMHDLRGMGENNALAGRLRHFSRRSVVHGFSDPRMAGFWPVSGRFLATFEIVTLTGWAPAESQPKPLRPGSAQARLADALGTTEFGSDTSKT